MVVFGLKMAFFNDSRSRTPVKLQLRDIAHKMYGINCIFF